MLFEILLISTVNFYINKKEQGSIVLGLYFVKNSLEVYV